MPGLVVQHRGEQVGGAVDHGRLAIEAVGRRYVALDTHDVMQAVEEGTGMAAMAIVAAEEDSTRLRTNLQSWAIPRVESP